MDFEWPWLRMCQKEFEAIIIMLSTSTSLIDLSTCLDGNKNILLLNWSRVESFVVVGGWSEFVKL